jgi:hypothetical protein
MKRHALRLQNIKARLHTAGRGVQSERRRHPLLLIPLASFALGLSFAFILPRLG